MIRKIVTIIICIFLTLTIIPLTNIVLAGDEHNPEIEDSRGDVPFGCIDIVSAWFFEDVEDPDYVYTAIKLRNLQYKWILTGYTINWLYNGSIYCVFLTTWGKGNYNICTVIKDGASVQQIIGSCDLENSIVAIKIPKKTIGEPKPGDVLRTPYIFSTYSMLGAMLAPLTPLSDYAPNNLRGNSYIVQY